MMDLKRLDLKRLNRLSWNWKIGGILAGLWVIAQIPIPIIAPLASKCFSWGVLGWLGYLGWRYRARLKRWGTTMLAQPAVKNFLADCKANTKREPLIHIVRDYKELRRGSEVIYPAQLARLIFRDKPEPTKTQLELGGVPIPEFYENLSFFYVGAPGSGKSVALKRNLITLRNRDDWRMIILDRNGELMENFFDPDRDVIFNPRDKRSVSWSHRSERVRPETLAGAILPDPVGDDVFFVQGARSMLADLYKRCESNSQVWEIINTFSIEDLQDFLAGTPSEKYFSSEKTAGSILSTLINDARFYEDMAPLEPGDDDKGFSFYHWAKGTDPRWVWIPLFEDDSEIYRPIITAAFELALKGLLSEEDRKIRTGFAIDELGAIAKLKSLPRLLSESRKFLGAGFLGTQTEAQLIKTYGKEVARMILQGCATKLILNCRDYETAETFAKVIGKQEILQTTDNMDKHWLWGDVRSGKSENVRERYTVDPTALQQLKPLNGYLSISGFNPAPVKLDYEPLKTLKHHAERLVLRKEMGADASAKMEANEDSWWEE